LIKYIVSEKIATQHQLKFAFDFLKDKKEVDDKVFEKECGVGMGKIIKIISAGVVVSEAEIVKVVGEILASKDADIKAKGWGAFGAIMKDAKDKLKFADPKLVNEQAEKQLEKLAGSKDSQKKAEKQVCETPLVLITF
jgi:Glu-tRNA(Gln) amidotransferase subunit E-like FAD-binding protein